jgi:hypothetical protein
MTGPQPPAGPQQPATPADWHNARITDAEARLAALPLPPGRTPCCGQPVALFSWMTCAEFDAMVSQHLIAAATDPAGYYQCHAIAMGMTPEEFGAMVRAGQELMAAPERKPAGCPPVRQVSTLEYYKRHGIEMGKQEVTLRDLAARYARKFTVAELADELFEVMKASPQRHVYGSDGPWTRSHAVSIAARAKRFTDRSDAAQERRDAEFYRFLVDTGFVAWAMRSHRRALESSPRLRQPGTRKPGTRKAGVRR